MQIGFIGLGKMGSRMVKKLLADGHEVVTWNRSKETMDNFVTSLKPNELQTFSPADNLGHLASSLQTPRVIWLMLPAGDATENILREILPLLDTGDIVTDGGNAHFSDTQKRFEQCEAKGIRFLGIGVSGGILAEKNGYPLMIGGDKTAYEHITPLLETLAKPHGGYAYLGTGGVGHFVKMVHNGIEYGMMQAIGEGFGVLEKSPYELDLLKVAQIWQQGTIISGLLMDCAAKVLEKDPALQHVAGYIEHSGEALWTVEQAEKENVPATVIKESLRFRTLSHTDEKVKNSFAAKMVASLRNVFGGHKIEESHS